ncbi:MAG: NAD-binding protein [Anaerolineae bacterium]|jgi:trk system potassium uptake protein TrkA|nr:NAD-binding protein [Anaerolineae bacterium]
MFVIIAGGGRTGAQLASLLVNQNHRVHLVEQRQEVLDRIHHELPTEVIYQGDPTNPTVLENAGIREAQVLAACTTHDADNLVLCYVARERYGVGRTIARINNPRSAWFFDEKFHVDVAINQADLMAKLIAEEMSLGDMMTLLKLRKGAVALVEEKIVAGAVADGAFVRDLKLPEDCTLAAIIRKEDVFAVRGDTQLRAGDEVIAVINTDQREGLASLLGRNASGA